MKVYYRQYYISRRDGYKISVLNIFEEANEDKPLVIKIN